LFQNGRLLHQNLIIQTAYAAVFRVQAADHQTAVVMLLLETIREKDDSAALEIAAVLTYHLHEKTSEFPEGLKPLDLLFSSVFTALETGRGLNAPLYRKAAQFLPDVRPDDDQRPLHGDLHFENIVSSPRGWLAIDPHGYLGNRAFEYANYFYNPRLQPEITDNVNRVERAAKLFSEVSGLSVKLFCFMHFFMAAFQHHGLWRIMTEKQRKPHLKLRN